jgi:DNA-binding NarL/FixJ family response regulator
MNPERLRVMLVDDHEMVRDGVRALLEAEGGISIVAEAGTPDIHDDQVGINRRGRPDCFLHAPERSRWTL